MKNTRTSIDSLKSIVVTKTKRLLVPFIVVFSLWNLPIKLISGYYVVPLPMILLQIIFPDNMYLWYLEALFMCFVIFTIIKRFSITWQSIIVILIFFAGLLAEKALGLYLPIGNPIKYIFWFWIGYYSDNLFAFFKERNFWNKATMVLILLIQFIIFLMTYILPHGSSWLNNTILPLMMFPVCFWLSEIIISYKKKYYFVDKFVKYGLGIYLYAEPLNYLILFIMVKAFGINILGNEMAAAIIVFLQLFGTSTVAILVVIFLKRYNLKFLY